MAKVRNSKGDGFLVDGNGDFIDSDLMGNDPLHMGVVEAKNEAVIKTVQLAHWESVC